MWQFFVVGIISLAHSTTLDFLQRVAIVREKPVPRELFQTNGPVPIRTGVFSFPSSHSREVACLLPARSPRAWRFFFFGKKINPQFEAECRPESLERSTAPATAPGAGFRHQSSQCPNQGGAGGKVTPPGLRERHRCVVLRKFKVLGSSPVQSCRRHQRWAADCLLNGSAPWNELLGANRH